MAVPCNINLICGDCLSEIQKLPNESIDLIVTDPPYKITARGNRGTTGGMLAKKISMQGQCFQFNNIDCVDYAPEFYRVLKDGSHCYIMSNHINLLHTLNTFVDTGFHFTKSLILDKGNKIMGRFYMSQFEYILFFRKGKGIQINNCGTSDIISVPNIKLKNDFGQNLHDTEKPVRLMEILIENSSRQGGTVLDPFMGIGSTGIACKKLNRNFIGFELDKEYFDIATARIKETG